MDETSPTGEQRLLRMVDSFLESKVLMTCAQVGLFESLAAGPLSRTELLERAKLPLRSGSILVDAACALGLLEVDGTQLSVPAALAPHLVVDSTTFQMVPYLINYYDKVYKDLQPMADLVRTDGASSQFKLRSYFQENVDDIDPRNAADYSAYMRQTMERIVEVVLDTYSFDKHTVLLDLCGGPGTFAAAVLRATPQLRGAFLEVPAVAKIGAEATPADLKDRLRTIGGDVFKDTLPGDADIITMCRAAHDWDDERILVLFRKVYQALPAGGRFLVIERMIPEHFDASARALYLRAVYFLCKSTTALYRSAEAYRAILGSVGFQETSVLVPERDPYAFFKGMKIVVAQK